MKQCIVKIETFLSERFKQQREYSNQFYSSALSLSLSLSYLLLPSARPLVALLPFRARLPPYGSHSVASNMNASVALFIK